MKNRFLQVLDRRVLVFDGAMGTSIHKLDLTIDGDYCGCENCTEILVKSRPDVIQTIHESFLAAGADCIETDTFGASELVLTEFGIADKTFELNKLAVDVARAACKKYSSSDKPRFVVGSIGPGTRLITLGNTTWDEMFKSYREQALGLLAGEPASGNKGGCDAFIIETCQDLLQLKCVINAILSALKENNLTPLDVPIMASVTIEATGTMLLGTSIEAAAAALREFPIISLGLNCATGPTEMVEHVHYLTHNFGGESCIPGFSRRVSVMPNAGLPVLLDGKASFPLGPKPFAEAMLRFIEEEGVDIVGGCCGTTPEHIRELSNAVESAGKSAASPAIRSRSRGMAKSAVTSLYSAVEYRQDTSILIIGERMNSSGSRAFKRLLESEDFDGIVSLAREQVRHDSAHILDVNVDYAGRDNARDMAEVVKRVVRQVDAPLMLDSTQLKTIEAGLRHAPGKCIINSGNFEDGEHKFDIVCELARTYGAGLVIGSIDEDKEASMARTADRKLAIAQRAFDRATKVHGLKAADLIFDPLVLPISTGMESDRRSGLETIEGVRLISKALPESQTTVGLSNVSFGLAPAARIVLNSVFLHELQEAGLTSAILHFSKILPRNKIDIAQWDAAMDLIYDRRREGFDPLHAFVALFQDAQSPAKTTQQRALASLEERLANHIVDGEKQGLIECLDEARQKYSPLAIINDHLLGGMKTVGELFGSGQMQLPFVLQSAEVMKAAVTHLEKFMEKAAGSSKGSIVLATVKGDVHDIGKNLVDIILSNNGYTVHNIGIKQPLSAIVESWRKTNADAIGMSGLLVKSVNVMEENLQELNKLGIEVPVLLGGAALTRHYCEGHLRSVYDGELFYGKDAFEGLSTMDQLMSGGSASLNTAIEERQRKRTNAEEVIARSRADQGRRVDAFEATKDQPSQQGTRSDVEILDAAQIPSPPFWGSRVVTDIDLDSIYPFINPVALFRGQWQLKKGALSDSDYEALLEDKIQPIFEELKKRCRDEAILRPAVTYGYFPCNSSGDELIIWDPSSTSDNPREIERFRFPRQGDRRRLCISDFLLPLTAGKFDVLGLHCVTMGSRASEAARKLFEANDYTNYLYLHGLGVETAEALAEFWHKRMRQEMGIAGEDAPRVKDLFTQHYRGSRYSFGYPACPDMSDQDKLWKLLDPSRIGCNLTENWQIDPEQSTSAIIIHHPQAKYFNV